MADDRRYTHSRAALGSDDARGRKSRRRLAHCRCTEHRNRSHSQVASGEVGDNRSLMPMYTPMAPTLVREPFHRDGWVYEEKVDGWRMLAYKEREAVTCGSAN